MGFAVLGLFAIPKMEPALQSPVPSVGIFAAFGEGLPDGRVSWSRPRIAWW
jgi:hypothetical protein